MRIGTRTCRSFARLMDPQRRVCLRSTQSAAPSVSRNLLRRLRHCFKSDGGTTLVETAIACSIFFALLLGVFEFSLAFYTYHFTSSAARQGSRYAIVRGADCQMNLPAAPASFHCGASETDVARYVKNLNYPGINSSKYMGVTVTSFSHDLTTTSNNQPHTVWSSCGRGTSCNAPGDQVQVTVTYDFPLSIPFWNKQSVRISSTSNMVYSQ